MKQFYRIVNWYANFDQPSQFAIRRKRNMVASRRKLRFCMMIYKGLHLADERNRTVLGWATMALLVFSILTFTDAGFGLGVGTYLKRYLGGSYILIEYVAAGLALLSIVFRFMVKHYEKDIDYLMEVHRSVSRYVDLSELHSTLPSIRHAHPILAVANRGALVDKLVRCSSVTYGDQVSMTTKHQQLSYWLAQNEQCLKVFSENNKIRAYHIVLPVSSKDLNKFRNGSVDEKKLRVHRRATNYIVLHEVYIDYEYLKVQHMMFAIIDGIYEHLAEFLPLRENCTARILFAPRSAGGKKFAESLGFTKTNEYRSGFPCYVLDFATSDHDNERTYNSKQIILKYLQKRISGSLS